MSSRVAPVASRRSSGATLPNPPRKELLNSSHNNADISSSQKSNSAVETLEDLLKPSIVVKPYPPKLSIQPRSLQPLMLLPREHLQLSYLDLSVPHGTFEYSRSFESSIKILDLEGRFGPRPVVLIARLESDKSIYALERQNGGLYSLCHVGSWVDLQDLEKVATVSLPQIVKKPTSTSKDSQPPALPPLTTPRLHHETKKRRLAIEALESIVKKPVRPRSASSTSQLLPLGPPTPGETGTETQVESARILRDELPTGILETQGENQAAKISEVDDTLTAPTAGAIFENIRNQYFESLYLSMGSLGYFAKGSLSRARAAFHLDCDANLEMNDLIGFLRSLVMTTTQLDKKYRETIPDIIAKMKSLFHDSDSEHANAKTKKRKAKKMKLGKDGLYPMEDDRIRKWWGIRKPQSKRDEDMTTTDTESHETKLQVAWLRSRETQLQMIIILEILALEPLVASRDEDSQLPGLPGPEPAAEAPKEAPPKKGKGRSNLPVLVDLHADRLCIWQSTSLDGVKFLAGQDSQEQNTQKAIDPLKDFCVDIIVPFFSARLPEQSDSISRKLGGPLMMPPPPKPKVKPEPAPKSKPKPGSAAKRPVMSKSKASKSLENVLSRESEKHRRSMSRGPSGVIALMRSATTPMLKREASEPLSLKSIPKADSTTPREKAPRPLTAAPPKRSDERAKKEALVQAELQDAISTLRRPNREVVGKDMAEAAERRANTSLSQLKKARKPTQHTRPQDSIVKATPVGKRYRDVFGTNANHRQTPRGLGPNEPSSTPFSLIPSSGIKKRTHESAFALESSPSITPFAHIAATPAKQLTLKQSFLSVPKPNDEDILASSPLVSRKSSSLSFHDSGIGFDELTETPIKPRAVPIPSDGIVAGTPTKRRILESTAANNSSNTKNPTAEPARKLSIYERLGWDDDLDELG
ncbi:DNA replication regulator SLD3-domain-containing protein [Annulohypoxylon maeteangense]|uniref:DNA replication regulator SLD3-domain-containing protein n=1 Tax=Annulohypoxylon maeteangense TaxID=1927788 RepID=UPI00200819F6|nr:DNA replication regulator SLD3-domain-containing protein [Annulohypoxylon maeteangense]KAI0882809.1 DNA replication regulator SLD3-domain-containing protein [Annulohypoxylon maeteangense]